MPTAYPHPMPTPAGWYPDTTTPGGERWWDGEKWTDARRASPRKPKMPRALLSSLSGRLAIAVAALFMVAAAAFTFVPASYGQTDCGMWFNPEWSAQKADKAAAEWEDLATGWEDLDSPGEASEARGNAAAAELIYPLCKDRLNARLGVTVASVTAGLLFAGAILFVAGARRRRSD